MSMHVQPAMYHLTTSRVHLAAAPPPRTSVAARSLATPRRRKPDLIVATGTFNGGSALFYASVLSLAHPSGRVHTIDPWRKRLQRSLQATRADEAAPHVMYMLMLARETCARS